MQNPEIFERTIGIQKWIPAQSILRNEIAGQTESISSEQSFYRGAGSEKLSHDFPAGTSFEAGGR
jgi:hypothetical protein